MTRIQLNGKNVIFRCDKLRSECPRECRMHPDYECGHTSDLEHAIWDGEKTFCLFGDAAYFEQ